MDGVIDGGGPGSADAPDSEPRTERDDTPWLGSVVDAELDRVGVQVATFAAGHRRFADDEPDDLDSPIETEPQRAAADGLSKAAESGIQLLELGLLPETLRRSVTDSVNAFVQFVGRRLVSVAADLALPVTGGRLVDMAFEIQDLVTSVLALAGDDPVLMAPLPSPVPGLAFTLEISLGDGDRGQTASPMALCVSPNAPSLTVGFALDAPEPDGQPAGDHQSGRAPGERPDDDGEEELERALLEREAAWRRVQAVEASDAAPPKPRDRGRRVVGCIAEADLESLPFLRGRRLRAWELYVLAGEYASWLRESSDLGGIEVLVIADRSRRFGVWIWLSPDLQGAGIISC
jgi:hypothetical protein